MGLHCARKCITELSSENNGFELGSPPQSCMLRAPPANPNRYQMLLLTEDSQTLARQGMETSASC